MAGLIVVANLLDLLTFFEAVEKHGVGGEWNPLFAFLWTASPLTFVILKVVGAFLVARGVGSLSGKRYAIGGILGIGMPILGIATNAVSVAL